MRNIEALKNYFLGKDPQLKETMADNSLRLIGIPGREFVLRTELMRKLKILRDELVKKDQELAEKVDEAVAEMERVAASIPFTMLDSDLHIYQDQPMNPLWESGWYNTGEYKVYFADTIDPIAFEHTLFYYNNAPGETYIIFLPETFVDNWTLLKLSLYWDEDEQEWFPDSIGIDDYIAENSVGIPTSSAVRYYVQNNVIHHLSNIAAASDLSQGLYVADDDVRIVGPYEQIQLSAGDFIIVQSGTGSISTFLIIIMKDKIEVATVSTSDQIQHREYGYVANAQTTDNLVTTISSSSTDTKYPSAKAVYDFASTIGIIPITLLDVNIYDLNNGVYSVPNGCVLHYGTLASQKIPPTGYDVYAGDILIVSNHTLSESNLMSGFFYISDNGYYTGVARNSSFGTIKYLFSDNIQLKELLTTTINSSSTDSQYPSAKATYEATLHTYSTTEKRVGTWIDGKPAYELTIIDDALSLSGGYGTLATTVANVENVCSSECYVGSPNTAGWRQGYLNSNYYSGLQCSVNSDNDLVMTIYAKEAVNPIKAKVIVRYTKTTD